MMRQRTKLLIKLWLNRLLWCCVLGLIIWINALRLQDNNYSNYEKVIDYGRIKDADKLVRPVIAAIFYAGKNNTKTSLSTYFNHSNNYKKQNVKMVVVPQNITSYSAEVIEKLYEEIRNNNKIKKVLLIYDKDDKNDVNAHKKILKQVMDVSEINENPVSQYNLNSEKTIDIYLKSTDNLVIFLADLDKGLNENNSNFLTGEAVYFAQKYHYQINVFDIVDTQLAKALDKDYETLYPLQTMKDEPLLAKQKRNLERFKRHYWHLLRNYFELNLIQISQGDAPILPLRTEENYRLYDRGRLVLKAFDKNYIEIFEQIEMQENKGIIMLLLDAIRHLVTSGKNKDAQYFKIYFLTDLEYIEQEKGTMLMSYLDQDDGIYAVYKDKYSLLVADDRPDNPEDLATTVQTKAKIGKDIPEEKINFYKFKTLEINYED